MDTGREGEEREGSSRFSVHGSRFTIRRERGEGGRESGKEGGRERERE